MTAAVFEARYHRILRSREQGYEELSDFLGRQPQLGPLVRLGLLRRREVNAEFQRYHGYVPTPTGEEYLLYIAEKELILVKPGLSGALFTALRKDPAPKAVFKPTYAEPTKDQFDQWRMQREQAGRDAWRVQRAEELHLALLSGYMDFRAFTKRTSVGEGALLRIELARPKERAHEHSLAFDLTREGQRYLEVRAASDLLLVKPGMELPLLQVCDPEGAAYWCELP